MLYAEHEKRKLLTRRSQSNLHGLLKNHTQKSAAHACRIGQLCRNSLQNHAGARGGKRLRTYRTVLTKTYGQWPQAPQSSKSQKHISPSRVPESAQRIIYIIYTIYQKKRDPNFGSAQLLWVQSANDQRSQKTLTSWHHSPDDSIENVKINLKRYRLVKATSNSDSHQHCSDAKRIPRG